MASFPGSSRFVFLHAAAEAATWPEEYQQCLLCIPFFWAIPVLLSMLTWRPPPPQGPPRQESSSPWLCSLRGLVAVSFAAAALLGVTLGLLISPIFLILALPSLIHSLLSLLLAGTKRPSALLQQQQLLMTSGDVTFQGATASPLHWLSLALFLLASLAFSLQTFLTLTLTHEGEGKQPPHETLFLASQALYWLALAFCLDWPRRTKTFHHSFLMREWMLVSFSASTLLAGSALFAHDSKQPLSLPMLAALCTWPLCLVLLDGVLRGRVSLDTPPNATANAKGRAQTPAASDLAQPLVGQPQGAPGQASSGQAQPIPSSEADIDALAPLPEEISVHGESLLSQALFLWMNPVMARGAVKHLTAQDCPRLSGDELAGTSYLRLVAQMRRQQEQLQKQQQKEQQRVKQRAGRQTQEDQSRQPLLEADSSSLSHPEAGG